MNLSELFDIKSINSALIVAAILGIPTLVWKKRKYLVQKFKNISSFLRLPQAKESFLDIYQRVFQSYKKIETKPNLQDYVRSFSQWKSKSETGITLYIKVNSEPVIYNNVISVSVSRIDPFSPLYKLDMELLKLGYALYTQAILGVRKKEIFRIARLIYYREIVESQNNETVPHN